MVELRGSTRPNWVVPLDGAFRVAVDEEWPARLGDDDEHREPLLQNTHDHTDRHERARGCAVSTNAATFLTTSSSPCKDRRAVSTLRIGVS